MRATYEDLLRTARRTAVSAKRGVYPDEAQVMADWQAVLSATKYHLRWLRCRLRTSPRGEPGPSGRSDNALGRLAQAIGAGADLLAVQDAAASSAFEVREDLIAARAEVASIALIGARAAVRNTEARTHGRTHLLRVAEELAVLADADVRRAGLGGLAGLAASWPTALVGDLSAVAAAAARWERAHASETPQTVLTRDLRSTTAQLRTVVSVARHLVTSLLSAPNAGLDRATRHSLLTVSSELQGFEASSQGVQAGWRRRLADLSGPSQSPGEEAYVELKQAVDSALRTGNRFRDAGDLAPNPRAAAQLIDVADELLWAAEQICRNQQSTVEWLIRAGRIFVPRREAALVDLRYLRRPTGGSRPLQAKWVRIARWECFEELTNDLADAARYLTTASGAVRRLAGTSTRSRRRAELVTRIPQVYLEDVSQMNDPGQEFAGLVR
ncbi:hypothetical protein [Kribbella shirazensis]|uniref:Uncharacterized protein n=1 Tax=Kribbella shirazensis TaxID=1105143 RepID=A0A7X6A5I8_9ACTN|nr:hypothetical protein [Kribbella shirazensis]NIK61309.1 hypothetical protein [Kribbella shirazensis]